MSIPSKIGDFFVGASKSIVNAVQKSWQAIRSLPGYVIPLAIIVVAVGGIVIFLISDRRESRAKEKADKTTIQDLTTRLNNLSQAQANDHRQVERIPAQIQQLQQNGVITQEAATALQQQLDDILHKQEEDAVAVDYSSDVSSEGEDQAGAAEEHGRFFAADVTFFNNAALRRRNIPPIARHDVEEGKRQSPSPGYH